MDDALRRCLDDLEERIDPREEDDLLGQWSDFSQGRFQGALFSPQRSAAAPPAVKWPEISVNAAFDDFDKMALGQFGACSRQLEQADGALLGVRANYGTGIVPLLFGLKPFVMDEEYDTLPTNEPLHDADAVGRLIDKGVPDLSIGLGERVLKMGERFVVIAREYPKIGRHVHIFHPDLQGPLDICELVWGSEVFLAFYDRPDLVAAALDLFTETYIAFLRAWERIVPFRPDGNCHWGMFHQGSIMIRNDSAMNISGELYEAFVRPRDQRLLDEFGGGAIHFCGRGDHYIAALPSLRGLRAVNLSQPEYNNMETILTHTVDRGVNIIGLSPQAAQSALAQDRDLHGRVHSTDGALYGKGSVVPANA